MKKDEILRAYIYIMWNGQYTFLQKYEGTKGEIEKETKYIHQLIEKETIYKIQYDHIN